MQNWKQDIEHRRDRERTPRIVIVLQVQRAAIQIGVAWLKRCHHPVCYCWTSFPTKRNVLEEVLNQNKGIYEERGRHVLQETGSQSWRKAEETPSTAEKQRSGWKLSRLSEGQTSWSRRNAFFFFFFTWYKWPYETLYWDVIGSNSWKD